MNRKPIRDLMSSLQTHMAERIKLLQTQQAALESELKSRAEEEKRLTTLYLLLEKHQV